MKTKIPLKRLHFGLSKKISRNSNIICSPCKNSSLLFNLTLFYLLVLSFSGQAQTTSTYTTTGTWTCPQGVTSIMVEAWGGGGAGGGSTSTANSAGGGGGGGAYARRNSITVIPGTIYNITIGSGGTSVQAATGGPGNSSTATINGITITATGGIGGGLGTAGIAGTGGSTIGCAGDIVFAGGKGAAGVTTPISGGGGGSAGSTSVGGAATGITGGSAGTANGAAGANGRNTQGLGTSGTVPGSGGSGGVGKTGVNGYAGGAGANGKMIITFTCPVNTIANAGANQILTSCATSTTMAANAATYGSGTWTLISGTATITSPNSPTSTVSGLVLGTTATLRWTILNGLCGSSFSDVTLTTSYGAGCWTYCAAGGNAAATSYISNVTLSSINQNNPSWGGYRDYYPTVSTSLIKSFSYTINVSIWNNTTSAKNISAWIDWNNNGTFDTATETVLSTTSTVAAAQTVVLSNTFTVPAGAVVNLSRLRVELAFNTEGAAAPCNINSLTDVQDYKINVINAVACITPTTQPTSLILTPSAGGFSGTFTAASPAPDSYLIVANTTGIVPTPVNGTTYAVGAAIGGSIVAASVTTNSFTTSGLNATTAYYIYVFSFNGLCSGGPLYVTTSPLTGTGTTLAVTYCTPSVTQAAYANLVYFTNISFVGTLNDTSNTSTYSTSPLGYQNFSGLASIAQQAQGEGINIASQTTSRGYLRAWVDWNRDGDFSDTGETVYDVGGIASYATTFGFIIPATQAIGIYRIRIRISKDGTGYYNFNSCESIPYYGETEDYLFTVIASCPALITSITNGSKCDIGSVTLTAVGASGVTQFRWYSALTGGSLLGTTSTGTWSTPSISATTTYYVTAFNGSCESLVRTAIVATINSIPSLSILPASPIICGQKSLISLTAGGSTQLIYLINESFESGLNGFTNVNYINNGATPNGLSAWQSRTSTFVPSQQVWFPAISSGFGTNKFVMATSDIGMDPAPPGTSGYKVHNALISPSVSSMTYTDLTLSFKTYYSRYYADGTNLALDYVTVDVSTDGGTVWTEIQRYTADIAYGTAFQAKTFNLNAYINKPNLKVRIRYYGEWCDGIAVDDVKLYGSVPLTTSFSWTSSSPVDAYNDLLCTVPYVQGTQATTVYVQPTLSQLELPIYTFTATVPLANGCSAAQTVNVTNNSRVWQGLSTDWNDANNWKPVGVPTSSNCVIIPTTTSIISGSGYNGYAKNLLVKNTGTLLIQSNNNLTVTDAINVEVGGAFYVKNNASLVQITPALPNTVAGIFNMERITQPMYRYDYTYWGSPVTLLSGFTLGSLSPNTLSDKYFSWKPTVGGSYGDWNYETASTVMDPRKGYIVRAPQSYSTNPSSKVTYTGNFIGAPNNGTVSSPITFGTLGATSNNDKYNLLANPYPSAISAASFLNLASNAALIDGTIYFWTHNSPPSTTYPDPFYNDFITNYSSTDYASWNKLGGVGTAAASGGNTPNGYITAGQAFFARSLAVTGNVTFDNTMRVTGNNSMFFRNANSNATTVATQDSENFEKHRLWLNLINSSGAFNQILIGYAEGATNGIDRDFDGRTFSQNNITFYSTIPGQTLVIQGRALPFNIADQVPLGYTSTTQDSFSIRIDHLDELFENQNIYIEDKVLNIIHDLKQSPYAFTSSIGTFNDRFVLRYENSSLAVANLAPSQILIAMINSRQLTIQAAQNIQNVQIYDISGKWIKTYIPKQESHNFMDDFVFAEGLYFAKIKLEDNNTLTRKLINSN